MDRTALFDALADEISADIIANTTEEARTAAELSEMMDTSRSTIYRRLDHLSEQGILKEGLEIDLEGNHRQTYRTAISHLEVEFAGGGIDLRVERREDEVDRFTRIWEDIRGNR